MGGRRMSKVWEEGKNGRGRREAMLEMDSVCRGAGRGEGQRENTECDSSD